MDDIVTPFWILRENIEIVENNTTNHIKMVWVWFSVWTYHFKQQLKLFLILYIFHMSYISVRTDE